MLDQNQHKHHIQIQNKSRSKLSNQKITLLSKSDSFKKNKKHKPIAFNTIKQKIPKSKREINSKTVELQSLQNQLQVLRKKKHFRVTVPFVNSVKLSTSKQNKFQGNSKSLQKTHKKTLKIHSHEQKSHVSQIKPQTSQTNKKSKSNTKSKGTNIKTKNPENFRQKQSKTEMKCKSGSQSTKKPQKAKHKNNQILKMIEKVHQQKLFKSRCITKNISKDNSKEKWHKGTNIELDSKFKKKNQVNTCLEKKTKKTNIYSSSKLSSRNSYKFVQTKSNQFLIIGEFDSTNPEKQINFAKSKQSNIQNAQLHIKKVNSEKNISERLKEHMDLRKQTLPEVNKVKNSSFKKGKQERIFNQLFSSQKEPINSKHNEVTIEKLLQATDDEIRLQFGCQEKEKSVQHALSQIEQFSFERLKQQVENFSSQQRLQELSIYESKYFNNNNSNNNNERSYSTSSDLFRISQQNNVDFTTLKVEKNTVKFMERVNVLDWISMLSQQLLLKTEMYHLACSYYDIYMAMEQQIEAKTSALSSKTIHDLKLIGLGCLLIAIKMDEREYEFDVLNAMVTLEKNFFKKDIVKAEFQILKKLKLKLKIQTLSFWSDYFSSKWDQFIEVQADASKVSVDKLFLRSVDGKSYENHRKVVSILNAIILDGGIYEYGLIEIVLSVFYCVFKEIVLEENRQKVLQQTNCLRESRQSIAIDDKYIFKNYVTRDTLDELSQSDLKQNQNQNNGRVSSSSASLIKRNCSNKNFTTKKEALQKSLFHLSDIFDKFITKTCKTTINQLKTSIKYISNFLDLKISFQMDQRVYEEARSYEEFIRYHTHSQFVQTFVTNKNSILSNLSNIPQINQKSFRKSQLTNVEAIV